MEIQICLRDERILKYIQTLHFEKCSPAIGILFGGDRLLCVDEFVVVEIDNEIIGLATIAQTGESKDGKPTVVAMYVEPKYRNQKIGYKLLEETINYMIEVGLTPIHMDVLNSKVIKIINQLPVEKKDLLVVRDCSSNGKLDFLLDS